MRVAGNGVPAGSAGTTARVSIASLATLRNATTRSSSFAPVPDGVYDACWGCRDTEDILSEAPTNTADRRSLALPDLAGATLTALQ